MLPGPIDSAVATTALQTPALGSAKASEGEFSELVVGALDRANSLQNEATAQAQKVAGGEGDIVESLLAASRADLSLRFVVSMRNRALDAYNEIMRLQV